MRFLSARRLLASALTVLLLAGGGVLTSISSALAQQCVGVNERVPLDQMLVTYSVKVDSCKVEELVGAYGQVMNASGLAGLLGARWWPVGVGAGVFFGWAWDNQNRVRECAAAGSGIEFIETQGFVNGCSAQ